MQHHEKEQSRYAERDTRSARLSKAGKSYYRRFKNLLLGIGFAMIAISVLPIPLGNASQKPPFTTLEIPASDLQPENRLPETPLPKTNLPKTSLPETVSTRLALSSHLTEPAQAGGAGQKAGGKTARQAKQEPILHTATVMEGDSLSVIFKRLKLPMSALYSILDTGDDAQRIKHLKPGETLDFEIGNDGENHRTVKRIGYRLDETTVLEITLDADSKNYRSRIVTETLEPRAVFAMGTIDQSLFLAGQRAGLSDKVIMELVGIFAWDVDFALNVRSGDHFALLYEQFYKKGEKIRDGNILAAEFVNQEHVFRAVRYENSKKGADYYTPDGHNMKKIFLRTPVAFSRISSRFQLRRWHPILHKFRAHRGVDYAAPRGTPVKATGSGKVTFVDRKGGLGKSIFVQHAGRYTTVYGHLDKYARGIKKGKRVRQGQLIGYVGSTGLATGPHLHYEFRVDGAHRDPLTVKLPKAESIEASYQADFQQKTKKLITQLSVLSRTMLAVEPGAPKGKG